MTANNPRHSELLAAYSTAVDLAQQRFRAAIEEPAAEYEAAVAGERAKLAAAEDDARRVYLESVAALDAGQ